MSRTVIYTPTIPFHHGEQISVIGTAALRSLENAPLDPYQWQFIAGKVDPERCLAGFFAYGDTIPRTRQQQCNLGGL